LFGILAFFQKISFLGFLGLNSYNINRLNVALTRAKYQRIIVGDQKFFKKQKGSDELKKLAENGGI